MNYNDDSCLLWRWGYGRIQIGGPEVMRIAIQHEISPAPMTTVPPTFRPFPAALLAVTFVLGSIVASVAFAELSNDSLVGPGLRSEPAYDGSDSQRIQLSLIHI